MGSECVSGEDVEVVAAIAQGGPLSSLLIALIETDVVLIYAVGVLVWEFGDQGLSGIPAALAFLQGLKW